MRYGSICSGIEAASVAWHPLGWKPAFFAEIDKFPSAVLAHRYPHIPNLGDFTAIRPDQHEPIDLLVGGTPCQSFSIAGLRGGMADARGNLALEFLRLADRARPRWLVWENVPGVLSSNKGRDFGAILGGMVELGYGIAYRVLDAQYVRVDGFGRAVPQRRRRVFIVGYLGDWRRAAAVLFERASLLGDSAPRREAGERVAPTISARPTGGGGLGSDFDFDGGLVTSTGNVAHCLNAGGMGRLDYETETMVAHTLLSKSNDSHAADLDTYVANSLKADGFDASEDGTGRGTPIIAVDWQNSAGGPNSTETFHTLTADRIPAIAFDCKASGQNGFGVGEIASTLRSMAHSNSHQNGGGHQAVAFDMRGREGGAQFEGPHETANIRAASGGSSRSYVAQTWAVRRLTPLECERLQGFPEIGKTVIIEICEAANRELAPSAIRHSASQKLASNAPVAARVLIDLERQHLHLSSLGRSIWSASLAERPSASPLSMQLDGFARLAALMTANLVKVIPPGRAELQASISNSFHRWSGSESARLSGLEIDALADDAVTFTAVMDRCMRSITSPVGRDSPDFGQILQISSSCAAHAIRRFIPSEIRAASSYAIAIESVGGYTNVPWRGKDFAPDGPRYKALGNSMAVNCMRWIGRRIEPLQTEQDVAA
jgi:DNA (cytosine-5)-methyltransferase 1